MKSNPHTNRPYLALALAVLKGMDATRACRMAGVNNVRPASTSRPRRAK